MGSGPDFELSERWKLKGRLHARVSGVAGSQAYISPAEFGLCSFVPIHWYSTDPNEFQQYVTNFHNTVGIDIWITEVRRPGVSTVRAIVTDENLSTPVNHSLMRLNATTARVSFTIQAGPVVQLPAPIKLWDESTDPSTQLGLFTRVWPHGSIRKITSSDTLLSE